jgi:DNA-directed RNA polymerase omega subunit
LNEQRRIDSKFRFVILAAKRAKQLLHGAKPRVKSRSKNPIRVAQEEVRGGAIDFEIIELKKDEIPEPTEEGFIGEEIGDIPEEIEEKDLIEDEEESSDEEEESSDEEEADEEEDEESEIPEEDEQGPEEKPKSKKKGKAAKK